MLLIEYSSTLGWGLNCEREPPQKRTVVLQQYGHIQHGSYRTLTYLMRNSKQRPPSGRIIRQQVEEGAPNTCIILLNDV